jgi:tetratricopeptide (TPR) repeat protein
MINIKYYYEYFRLDKLAGIFKTSPYDCVVELGRTAVERFGNDPKKFRETLKKFKPKEFLKRSKEEAICLPAQSLSFDSWSIREYINCLVAILQVDLECPGFIQNFPEAIEYLNAVNGNNVNHITYKFEKMYEEAIKTFNRYSGKSDFKYVTKLFEIPMEEKSCRYEKIRFDDYISLHFLEYWKSGDEEKVRYLKKYYIHHETLLPEDYQNLINYLGILKSDDEKPEDGALGWVDLYFENIDHIIEVLNKDIRILPPVYTKMINLTLT